MLRISQTVDCTLVNMLQVQPLTESEKESLELMGSSFTGTATEVKTFFLITFVTMSAFPLLPPNRKTTSHL